MSSYKIALEQLPYNRRYLSAYQVFLNGVRCAVVAKTNQDELSQRWEVWVQDRNWANPAGIYPSRALAIVGAIKARVQIPIDA